MKQNNKKNNENNSFEDKLNRLKEVVKMMDEGNLSLDKSLELFEEGINLYRSCNSIIDNAEQKITVLLESEQGKTIEKPFFNLEEESDEL